MTLKTAETRTDVILKVHPAPPEPSGGGTGGEEEAPTEPHTLCDQSSPALASLPGVPNRILWGFFNWKLSK